MKSLFFHIGAPKCGSTTTQKFAAKHLMGGDIVNAAGKVVKYYAVFQRDGTIYVKTRPESSQSKAPTPASSMDLYLLKGRIGSVLDVVLNDLPENGIGVLSCEGWAYSLSRDSALADEIDQVGVSIDVFLAVRPPLDWLNSAWLQWGAFTGLDIDEWLIAKIDGELCQFDFYAQYCAWKKMNSVRSISVFDVSQDVLKQFQLSLDLKPQEQKQHNVSTHPALFDYVYRNRKRLGRTEHQNQIEIVLNTLVDLPPKKSPIYISEKIRRRCADKHGANMAQLISLIDSQSDQKLQIDLENRYVNCQYGPSQIYRDWNSGASREDSEELIDALMERVVKVVQERAGKRVAADQSH